MLFISVYHYDANDNSRAWLPPARFSLTLLLRMHTYITAHTHTHTEIHPPPLIRFV